MSKGKLSRKRATRKRRNEINPMILDFHPCKPPFGRCGEVHLSEALARKYPNAPSDWCWQYLFASATLCPHPRTGKIVRHHLHEASMQLQFKNAVRKAAFQIALGTSFVDA